MWLLTWLPGQGTDLHDHGGSSGAFLVVTGELTEHAITHPGGQLQLVATTLPAGQGRSFGPRHIHQITNISRKPAVSLHVYGPALTEMTRYHLADGKLAVSAVDRAGSDW